MILTTIIDAFRRGSELPNATGVKWAGFAFTGISLVLTAIAGYALSHGWIGAAIPPEQIYELSSAIVSAVLAALGAVQVATTPRIGILPARNDNPSDNGLQSSEHPNDKGMPPDFDDQSHGIPKPNPKPRFRKPGPFGY